MNNFSSDERPPKVKTLVLVHIFGKLHLLLSCAAFAAARILMAGNF